MRRLVGFGVLGFLAAASLAVAGQFSARVPAGLSWDSIAEVSFVMTLCAVLFQEVFIRRRRRNVLQATCRLCGHREALAMFPQRVRLPITRQVLVVRCRNCGLGYLHPQPQAQEIPYAYETETYQAYHDLELEESGSTGYADRVRRKLRRYLFQLMKEGTPRRWDQRLMAFILQHRFGGVPIPRGEKRLLDVGCGDGAALQFLRESGWRVWGVEMNPAAAAAAIKRGIEVFQGTFESVPFAPASFDVVRLWHVLEHTEDPLAALHKAQTLLAPGGELILGVPNLNALYRRLHGRRWTGWQIPKHLYHFTPKTIRMCLDRSDFRDVRVTFSSVGTGLLSPNPPLLLRGGLLLADLCLDTLRLGDSLEVRAVKGFESNGGSVSQKTQRISVVIPTYNGRSHLVECLKALQHQTLPPNEVIVVDNGSSDGTADWIREQFPWVRLVALDKNDGFARPNNIGATQALSEHLLFLNNDAVPEPDCLAQLLQAFHSESSVGVSCAKIRLRHDPQRLDTIGSLLTWTGFLHHIGFLEEDQGQYDRLQTLFSPKGVCFLMSRKSFQSIGGFDERFFAYFDETDLFWRVWLSGEKILFAPKAVAYHTVGGTSGTFHSSVIEFHSYKNRLRTLIKNLGGLRLVLVLPIHWFCCLLITCGYILRGRWRNAAAVGGAWGWNLIVLTDTLKHRGRIQRRLRRVSDRILFRTFWVRPSWQDVWLGIRLIFFRRGLWQQYRGVTQLPEGLH